MWTTVARSLRSGIVALSIVGIAAPSGWAQEKGVQKGAEKPAAADTVPLGKVVMFTSGVGYFERNGEVEGDAQVELKFNAEDINDLLKSMVLEDRGGGKISTVTYGSRDPITKTLKTFPIDLTDNPTLADILNQVRGERVQVEAVDSVSGTLLGVEKRRKEVGNDKVVEVEFLNLLTEDGLRSVPMDSISRIKLLNPQLDKDFHQALAVLASGHNNDKKSVTLDFLGTGKRPVRVGYIQQTPVWKTSYRLVLDDKGQPFLQGWAIVENTTEEDWNDVQLTLVSGRPISYRMDLYEPLYVERPLEQLQLYASLRPQVYGQDLDQPNEQLQHMAKSPRYTPMYARGSGKAENAASGEPVPTAAPQSDAVLDTLGTAEVAFGTRLESSVSGAQAGDVGELFQYVIDMPVTLARQKSAMLPIVNESVKGEKVSIYNQLVQAKHPLNGLRLMNSTDLNLMQGPITVFDGATYAGDAKIEDLAPGAERLLSYALDLKTEVAPQTKGHPEQLTSVKIVKGTLEITRKFVRQTDYTIKNSDSKAKTVLIEQPLEANWKLVTPAEPTEKTRDQYRFAVNAEPGKPATLEVTEEQIAQQSLALTNVDDGLIAYFTSQKVVSPEVKAALQEVVKRKHALQQVVNEQQQLTHRIVEITQEQQRIRENMGQLDRNSDLYRRYVQKFGDQETTVEKLRGEIEKQKVEATRQRAALDEYLMNLTI